MKKTAHKVDRGFCLSYRRLSYRRKLIRTLWFYPPLCYLFATWIAPFHLVDGLYFGLFLVLFLAMTSIQAAYNYRMWKKEEASDESSQPSGDDGREG